MSVNLKMSTNSLNDITSCEDANAHEIQRLKLSVKRERRDYDFMIADLQ